MQKSKENKDKKIYCDRTAFIALYEGILFERDAKGHVVIGDVLEAHKALDAYERGQEVILTNNGKEFSRFVNDEEILINEIKQF